MILLQISTQAVEAAEEVAKEDITVFGLLLEGGYMMIPILLLSIAAVYIFVERLLTINKATQTPAGFLEQLKSLVAKGDIQGARVLCAQSDVPVSRMMEKGISRIGSPLKTIEDSIENVGKIELYRLEKNLPMLATISGAAPMIGFLGTVTGMIQAFIAIADEKGSVSPQLLSQGIYEAMVTTAAGLFVGILAYLSYNFLVTRVQKIVHNMEFTSINFLELLQEPDK